MRSDSTLQSFISPSTRLTAAEAHKAGDFNPKVEYQSEYCGYLLEHLNMFVKRQGGPLLPVDVSLDSHGSMIVGIVSAFTTVACGMIIARLYVRAFMIKTFGTDDWIILVAMASSLAVLGCMIQEVKLGVGEHLGNPHQTANFAAILHYSYFHGSAIVIGISSVKISVGFFLLRLVQGKWYKASISNSHVS